MAGALATAEKRIAVVPALAMASRFSKYSPETEKTVRTAEVAEDKVLAQLKEAWDSYLSIQAGVRNDAPAHYSFAVARLEGTSYSSEAVAGFSIMLAGYQHIPFFGSKAGCFLSALINNGADSDYVIHARHLVPINHFAHCNAKNIVVEGGLGAYTGTRMSGGSITVKGDIGTEAGRYMTGGSIAVEGNAGTMLGRMMRGGVISVKGDAGDRIGWGAGGNATIYVDGEAGLILRPKDSARIFHKGRMIYGKKF